MNDILQRIATAVERGKTDRDAPYPPDLRGEEGAAELTARALQQGIPPERVLADALVQGMQAVGDRFERGQAFLPDLLIAARAMTAAMAHLRPAFESGAVQHRGTFVVGTVAGDLHDIGKRIVAMVMEGNGWKVVDLGINVPAARFLEAIPGQDRCVVGLSALLTTTMPAMENTVRTIKAQHPEVPVFVGGAPVTAEFGARIGADGYFPNPQGLVRHLGRRGV
ncbi:MAG: cobalamin-dependent protein [Planctomycetes bacterium]|nr:cobalamin-dependent protein [Planctomycetota bacterium]